MSIKQIVIICSFTALGNIGFCQDNEEYVKRVLEYTEIDLLSSYYNQDGENAAVSGGIGDETLDDVTGTIIISIPLNDNDVLSIDGGISAYSSASSSNVNPFDGDVASPFIASSGESKRDTWFTGKLGYSHSSKDRNKIISGNASFANEYDYNSIGIGGSYAQLFNKKNTELNINASAYFDSWSLIYPVELRPLGNGGGDDDDDFDITQYTITGNPNYNPNFTTLADNKRNSYSLGIGGSQILSKKWQGSMVVDMVLQEGLLSTPFQRVYFGDVQDSFIENFHLADDVERLPDSRFKTAIGSRLNGYINENVTVRTFYRYYTDNWGMNSHTASIEVPIKTFNGKLTLYPSYRYYNQTAVDYFQPYNEHTSTNEFYTSDYDLSDYNSNQLGFGLSYSNPYKDMRLGPLGFKSIDAKVFKYDRNSSFSSYFGTLGVKFQLTKK